MLFYFLLSCVGLFLGILGAGGSILSIPIFTKVLGFSLEKSLPYVLFLVAINSLVAAGSYIKEKKIYWQGVFLFSAPSSLVAFVTKNYLWPMLPHSFYLHNIWIQKESLLIFCFCLLLFNTSYRMFKKNKETQPKMSVFKIIFLMVFVGILVGLLGTGGGFLIVPALVLGFGISIDKAIGTSLLIIALNTSTSFLTQISQVDLDYVLAFQAMSACLIGILIGFFVKPYLSQQLLKKLFASILGMVGVLMLYDLLFIK